MRLTDIMSNADLTIWPEIAMVIFAVVFTALCVRTFAKGQKAAYEEAARLPLEATDD